MKWICPLVLALVVGWTTVPVGAQQMPQAMPTQTESKPLTYAEAFELARNGDKPLLVMVTASWCPPCQALKASTLPTLMHRQSFKNFHFAMLDYDSDSEIANQLIGNRGLPQLVMYEKSNGKWLRRYINGKKGIHSVEKVESFVAQAGTLRLANSAGEASSKK